ncbi:hypothetical protein MUG84_00075 [Paenibacillus sp. KQZ6P-2]|uniref:Uncharacterized protein n=1 Tax=Paenibacillus mangrovi TaxID=2931978 RepID=A0A9X1WKE7_9BACL|nr:hypothetical protein [Paenibacillus mangrovi]MCJ8010136.1 hypothetical protein [Paenibacillus mangrovi]
MKLNDYVQVVRPQYVYLRLKPSNSIRNNNTHKIVRAIGSLYKNMLESIKREREKVIRAFGKQFVIPTKISLQLAAKVGYYIYIENKKVEFYFVIPKQHLTFMREKLGSTWNDVTIEEVENIPAFHEQATKYQLVYKKEDGLSLAVDRRSNDLLCSNLNIVEVLEGIDKVGIFYNFIPTSQYGWKFKHQSTIEKVKNCEPVDRDKVGFLYLLKIVMVMIDDLMNSVAGVMGKQQSTEQGTNILASVLDRLNGGRAISESTVKKGNSIVISTQIIVLSESSDKVRERSNARSLASSFDMISQDNELIYKPLRSRVRFTDYSLGAERNKVGDEEAQNFITLAGRDVLERYNFIEKIETHETEVPEDLQTGVMCIGTNRYRGKDQLAYLSNDREFRNLLTLLIGPTRAGKSNLICNLAIDAIKAGECVIVFDFIENCELSDEVAKQFPNDKVFQIRCDNGIEGLGYNEVGISTDCFKQYENAKRQTSNMMTLVNSINTDESRLSPKMERYLESASLVVFISGGSIRDVFSVLQNHVARMKFLNNVPRTQHDNLAEYMDSLRELDDLSKDGQISGTKTSSIIGIIDRLHMLKRNTYMELMLKKDCTQNVNLVEEMQKNQLITIKMPQNMFTTDSERDIYTTYWITKIWLALQVRADQIRDKSKRLKVNLIIDELYQVDYTEQFITSKLSQMAKFICKPIISCHYINQLRHMRDELRSANTSYMLLAGCDKKNYDELKNELYPFTDEDLRNLPRYCSMNYIKSKEGYARFITKLPGEVNKRSVRS